MTNANKKRFKRGDPLVYKGMQFNTRKVLYYSVGHRTYFNYEKFNKLLNNNECKIIKANYLKAVKKFRKIDPDIAFDDHRLLFYSIS